jgi:four helix bundle protein
MKAPNVCLDKSVEFSIAIIKCTERIAKEKNEYVLTKQLLKSGTSIGANVSEAVYAQSNQTLSINFLSL